MDRLASVRAMCVIFDAPQSVIAQITKNMTPVDYDRRGVRRCGLYRVAEVAEALEEETKIKLERAQKHVAFYNDRLRRLSPYLDAE